ncbi:hypothetical protein C8R43DRAFT_86191 [Mycena crocata]|nr:hypothetical protein C8R43DRAFT_86191 [Mycena crocata]
MERRPLIVPIQRLSSQESITKDDKWDSRSIESGVQYTRRLKWPLAVIIGQLLLLSLSLGFFGTVRARGKIPLQKTLAEIFVDSPQTKTYLSTFLATALSTFSSYLFSQAVRHAIVVSLTRPVEVSTLQYGISISRRSLIFEFRQAKWVLAAGVFFLATLMQTAGWSSLLTPSSILVHTPLEGTELDLSSSAFNDQFLDLWDGNVQSYVNATLLSIIETSGETSANSAIGYNGILDYYGYAHQASTGGVYPVYLVDAAGSNPDFMMTTTNTKPFPPLSITTNMSMSQQGVTAAVSCKTQELTPNSNPPLERYADPALLKVENGPSFAYTAFSSATTCAGGDRFFIGPQLMSLNNTLFAMACPRNFTPEIQTYTIIIDAQAEGSMYSEMGTLVCQVTPQIQNMTTVYYEDGQYVSTTPDLTYAPASAGAISLAAIYGIMESLVFGQSDSRNAVGDAIIAIFWDQASEEKLTYEQIWAAYIKGVVEFMGTAVKTQVAAPNGPFSGRPPKNMTKATNGTAFTTTLGWEYRASTTGIILIPSTFVALASILIVIVAHFYNRGGIEMRHRDFDPSDPVSLMAAASAGGMGDTFHGLAKGDVKEGRRNKVILGQIGERDGFVHVDA